MDRVYLLVSNHIPLLAHSVVGSFVRSLARMFVHGACVRYLLDGESALDKHKFAIFMLTLSFSRFRLEHSPYVLPSVCCCAHTAYIFITVWKSIVYAAIELEPIPQFMNTFNNFYKTEKKRWNELNRIHAKRMCMYERLCFRVCVCVRCMFR